MIDHDSDGLPIIAGDLIGTRIHSYLIVIASKQQLYCLHDDNHLNRRIDDVNKGV